MHWISVLVSVSTVALGENSGGIKPDGFLDSHNCLDSE